VSTGDVKKVLQVMSLSIASNTYGADQVGLISGFVFPISAVQAIGSMRHWISCGIARLMALSGCISIWRMWHASAGCVPISLPEDFDEMLHAGGGSTRIEPGWHVAGVINDVALGFGGEPMWPPCGWRPGRACW
jgi:zinc transporter